MGRTYGNGQFRPLRKRMSKHNQEKRGFRIEARKTVAQHLSTENAITRGGIVYVAQVLHRGFWGRLKWLLVGLPTPPKAQ